jgi:hypothetical protein
MKVLTVKTEPEGRPQKCPHCGSVAFGDTGTATAGEAGCGHRPLQVRPV